jgi:hypothetical protein
MSDYPVVRAAQPGDSHLRLRLVALTAVVIGVMLVALAAFLFSYTGIRQIALQAGVSPGLARLYPLMFDAMLIVTCSAVLATRTAGWGTKSYVWVCLLLVVAAVAVGDALTATGVHLTGQAARATIAVVPWVLLLMGFGIWLVMLRHWRRVRVAEGVNGAEDDLTAPAGRNGHASRAAPARQADRAPAIPAGPSDRDRAAQAMAASAAAGGAVSWAAGRGAAAARPRTPRVGIDSLLEQQAGRAPERPPAADSPAAASRAAATGQGKQRTGAGERQPAGITTAAAAAIAAGTKRGTSDETKPGITADSKAGTAEGSKAGTAEDSKAGTADETKSGTSDETKPGTAAETKPGTIAGTAAAAAGTAATTPGTAGTTDGTAGTTDGTAGTTPGTAATTPGTAGTTEGTAGTTPGTSASDAGAGAGATGAADSAETGRDGGGKDQAPAQGRRRRLGGLLGRPAGADDEAGEADGPAGAAAAEPDPANPPAPLPHFDRPRSTPTPPQETGADEE